MIFFRDSLVVQWSGLHAPAAGSVGSIPRSGRPVGEGNGNPLQYSCLEGYSPWARKSRTYLSDQTTTTGRLPHLRCLIKPVS